MSKSEMIRQYTQPERKHAARRGDTRRDAVRPGSGRPDSVRSGSGRSGSGRSGEDGYILIAVLFLAVMVLIALSIAAPKMAASIERDRELELQHRGKQYVRAIKLYYKKFGAYPPNMEALEKTSEIRYLRQRYKDPITGKDEWHLIHFGENKTPTAMGFFGQPLAGSTIAGIGPGGVGTSAGGGLFGNSGAGSNGGFGSSSGFGSTSGLGSNSGLNSTSGQGSSNSAGGGSGTNGTGNGSTSGTDPNAPNGSSGNSGSSTSGSSTTSGFGSNSSGNNQTFGGGGIIGIESTSPKQAILEYKKKKHFNEWEFVYDPLADQTTISNNTGIGQPAAPGGTNGIATPGTFGNQPGSGNLPPQQQQQQQQQQPTQPTTPPQ
jgi:type II secretory pathway pseudopilin PulG